MTIHTDHVADSITADGGAVPKIGDALRSIWVPAGAILPTVTAGCGALVQTETTAGRPDINALPFDTTTEEHAQFSLAFPKGWNLGTITYKAHWTGIAAGAGGVSWGLSGVACADDDTIDVVFGTEIVVDDTFIAIEDVHVSPISGALTIDGSPAADELCFFDVARVVDDANDTRAADADLLGIMLFYTITIFTDV